MNSRGFSIVELLIVIVVIGILAAITIVSFIGVSQRAISVSLQSDASNGARQVILSKTQSNDESYPGSVSDCPTPSQGNLCLKSSGNNTFTYQVNNAISPKVFSLIVTNGAISYKVTNDSSVALVVPISCPSNYIWVPGSVTYGTSDFCLMKYEAKNVGGVATSQAALAPWASITQSAAATAATNACSGCHLITEAEWLTVAQNVLSVAGNWSGGSVGSGFIYSGHSDNVPANSIAADTNDANGYINTGNTTGSNQRRTLTLTNGEVIWDFAGNLWEWLPNTISGGQQPGLLGEVIYDWKEWNNSSLLQNTLPNSSLPAYTGISGITGLNSTNRIGQLFSNYGETGVRAFVRGGQWGSGIGSGVLTLGMNFSPTNAPIFIGFRVAK